MVELTQSCAEKQYEVSQSELPLSCPMPGMVSWNAHPRVFLSFESEGNAVSCPYCGSKYILVD